MSVDEGTDWVLALDASTPRCVIALGRLDRESGQATFVDGTTVGERPNEASERLVSSICALVAGAGITASGLGLVACGCGPGMFTGTRVAVATAMGLSLGARCPAVQVSTLAAVAASARADGPVLALLDARRDEVYGAQFSVRRPVDARPQITAVSEQHCVPLSALAASLPAGFADDLIAVGPGVAPYAAALPSSVAAAAESMPGPTPRGLWLASVAAALDGAVVAPADLRAVYLRQSYAQMGVNVPKNPPKRSPFV